MDDNKTYKVGSSLYDIPQKDISSFLKDNPNATETEGYTVGKDVFDIPITEKDSFLKDNPNALPVKKKASPLDLASKGQTVLQELGQPLNESSTPPLPSTSGEPVQKTEEFTSPEQVPIIEQPSDATSVNIVTRPNIPTPPVTEFKQGKNEAQTAGELLTATGGELDRKIGSLFGDVASLGTMAGTGITQLFLGKEKAGQFEKIRKAGGFALPGAISLHPVQMLSDALVNAATYSKELPSGNTPLGIIGQIIKGGVDVAPDIMAAMATDGAILLPKIAAKIGLKEVSGFAVEQATRGLIQGAQEEKDDPNFLKQISIPLLQGLEKGMTGWMFGGLSESGASLGSKIADSYIANPKNYVEQLNKALLQQGTTSLATGMYMTGYGGLDEFVRTGRITEENLLSGFGLGVGLSMGNMHKLLLAKGLNTFLTMPKEGVHNAINSELSAKELSDKANEIATKVDNGESQNREGDAVMAFMLAKASQVKALSDQINENPNEVKKVIDESTLDSKAKEAITDKVNEINADNNPKVQVGLIINTKIAKIDAALKSISDNKSWSDTMKEVESAPLKERKDELKQEFKELAYGIKPKEPKKGLDGKVIEQPKAVQTESSKKLLDELDSPKENPKISIEEQKAEIERKRQEEFGKTDDVLLESAIPVMEDALGSNNGGYAIGMGQNPNGIVVFVNKGFESIEGTVVRATKGEHKALKRLDLELETEMITRKEYKEKQDKLLKDILQRGLKENKRVQFKAELNTVQKVNEKYDKLLDDIDKPKIQDDTVIPVTIGEKTPITDSEKRILKPTDDAFNIPIKKGDTEIGKATVENTADGWRIKWIGVDRTDNTTRGSGRDAMRLLNEEAKKEGKVLVSDVEGKNSANMISAWEKLVESGDAEFLGGESYAFKKAEGGAQTDATQTGVVSDVTQSDVSQIKQENATEVGFTPKEVIEKGYSELKDKIGEKKAQKYFQQVDKIFDPNKTTIAEYRENGVVVKEGDKYIFHALSGMDTKVWRDAFQTDVTDQFATQSKDIPLSDNTVKTEVNKPSDTPSDTNVLPTGDNGSSAVIQGENIGRNDSERTLLLRFRNAKNISEDFKKDLDENVDYTYSKIPNEVTSADVDYLIGTKGIDATEKAILNNESGLAPRVRMLAGVRVMKALGELAIQARESGDLKAEADYRSRRVDMAQHLSDKALDMGRGIQILGSQEVMAELEPVEHVMIQKRLMREQRDTMLNRKGNKKDVTTKQKEFHKANEEAIDEVVKSKEYEDLKKRVEELEAKLAEKPKPPKEKPTSETQTKIKKEQDYRKSQWDIILKGKQTSVSAIGLSSEQIEAFGNIVGSYVREGVTRTEDLVTRLKKEYFKASGGKILSDDDIKKILPEKVDGKTLKEINDEGESKDAAKRLADRVDKMLKDPKTPKDDPVKQMIDSLFEKVKEKDTKEKVPVTKKTALEKIQEAILNKKEYAEVWERAKEEVVLKINSNDALTEEQKSEYNKRLADFYNEVVGEPYSEKQVGDVTRKGIKDNEINIDQVVREHYTVYDATKRSLQDKLVDNLGLSPEDAKMLSDAIGKQFDKIAVAKKQAILKRGITAKEVVRSKTAKEVWQKLIEDSNLGAFSDSEFAEAYADKWGFPKLTDEQATEIERLSAKVFKSPEGYQKYEAIQDLLKYQISLPGIDKGQLGTSIWYNFILSGVRTQWKNIFANTVNATTEMAVGLIKNPKNVHALVAGAWRGSSRGAIEAGHILKTGYNPIKGGKVEGPSTTEILSDKNIFSYAKYVTRWMVAADMFTYGGLKEMRSYELAMNMARKENAEADKPSMSNWDKANEILYNTSERRAEAEKQAELEGLSGKDAKRRVWEVMEQSRGVEMIEDANNFAARGTFNHSTEGVLGLFTDAINSVINKVTLKVVNPFSEKTHTIQPLKLVVPFTRIVANVANNSLDYFPPTGYQRAIRGKMGLESMGSKYREYSKDEQKKLYIKASLGLASMVALYAWSQQKDDKGESNFEITANGTGDIAKNNELKSRKQWQAYSVRIGDQWYSYQYTPLIFSLSLIGIMNDAQKYQSDKIKQKDLIGLLGFATFKNMSVFSDMTALAQVSSLMGALSTGDMNKGQSFMTNLVSSSAKGFIYPKLAEQTVQTIDGLMGNPRKDAQGLVGKITRDLPIVRGKYGMDYKPMLNVIGEPVMYDVVQMTGKMKPDPFWDFTEKHNLFIGKPNAKTPIYDDINKVERGMTDDEYYEFIKKSGQEIKRRITNEVMTSKMSDDDILKAVTKIKSEVRTTVKTEMFGWGDLRLDNPEAWKSMRDKNLLQVPQTSFPDEVISDKEKISFSEEEIKEINKNAMDLYSKSVLKYVNKTSSEKDKKKTVMESTGETNEYELNIHDLWTDAKADAKDDVVKRKVEESKKIKS